MMLHKIKMQDIINDNKDVFQTYLTVFSQDYTVYTLVVSFSTINQGALGFNIQHRGTNECTMMATQWINNMTYSYKIKFNSAIFEKSLRKMMTYHIKDVGHQISYNNNTDVINLINKIIENGTYVQN